VRPRVARRSRYLTWAALGLWAAIIFLLAPLAGKAGEVESTDPALELPQSAEATRAMVREREAFPDTDTPVAVVIYVRDTGITAGDQSTVEADRIAFASLARGNVVGPAVSSKDERALLLTFPILGGAPQSQVVVGQIKNHLADSPTGLRTAVTGSAGALADASEAFGEVETTLLLAAAGVVAVLLLVTYRSPFLWLLPLASVGLASQLATGVVYLLGRHAGVTVTPTSIGLMVVIVFGVGTDYALLLIARYREELHRHADRYTAIDVAWRRSFPAIVGSAATTALGLSCLLAAQMNNVRGLGPVAAAGIVVACAVMTTLLPAMLVLMGRWVFWPFIPRYGTAAGVDVTAQHGLWSRLADAVGRRPRAIWLVATVALVALSFGVLGLRPGQPTEVYTKDVGSVIGQQLIEAHYPSGSSSPVTIIAAAPSADAVVAAAAAVDGVAAATHSGISSDDRWVRVVAVLDDPPNSTEAKQTVDQLRDAVRPIPGADVLVGGRTATTMDLERAASRDNLVLMPLILVVVFMVLMLLLRAVVAPLLLAASVALSFVSAWGLAGLVFRAIGYPEVDPSLLLWAYLFLVTLGVDYTIFLMTRAREEVARLGNRDGVLSALTVTGGVITSAGIVLAATFATLVVLPIVAILQIGLVVAIGVLLDTLVVRTLLMPALAVDIGARVWWPSRLAGRQAEPQPSQGAVELAGWPTRGHGS
jgi:putative drug exporter of the RND superfamily